MDCRLQNAALSFKIYLGGPPLAIILTIRLKTIHSLLHYLPTFLSSGCSQIVAKCLDQMGESRDYCTVVSNRGNERCQNEHGMNFIL